MTSTVAVIGLGNMGGAVAARLATAFTTTGFDPFPDARARAESDGVRPAASIRDAVAEADVIITSLPTPAIARAAWMDPDGVIAEARPGSTVIELSTIDPQTMRDFGAAGQRAGLRVVDSPVSGGPNEARAGKLVLLVGGDDADVDAASDALETIGTINRTGALGTAKVVKIVNNMMTMANVAAASEAFALGVAAGVDPERLFDLLKNSGGTSQHFVKRFPWVLAGDYDARFSLEMGEKDLALALELARAEHMPAPVAATGQSLYQNAIRSGLAGKDIVALHALYTRWATEPT